MKIWYKNIVVSLLITTSFICSATIIDFTDEAVWRYVDGNETYSANYNGIDVTLGTVGSGNLTFNGYEGTGILPLTNGGFLQGDGDGIGISSIGVSSIGNYDEINSRDGVSETLTVDFMQPFIIEEIFVLDLFSNEVAVYSTESSSNYSANNDNSNASSSRWGFHEIITFDTQGTYQLSFTAAATRFGDDGDSDYALAGMRIAEVSEPSLIALVIVSVLILFAKKGQRYDTMSERLN